MTELDLDAIEKRADHADEERRDFISATAVDNLRSQSDVRPLVAAVRAVLALHQPTAILTDRDGTEHVICGSCRMVSCPTVAAVGAVGGQE